tara:strand:- start:26 stop:346 length:321 start_codon:yes stop_codon:yes gene_type:complete
MSPDILDFLEKRAESHNKRYGNLPSKHCEIDTLIIIYERHIKYCKAMLITKESKKQAIFKQRLQDYMRVLRTGFIRDTLDTLVWEDLELLPDNHRMKPPYKISVYT